MERTAIVTGGSHGFGKAIATGLVARGWTVVIDGRDPRALAAAGRKTGAVIVPGDVTIAAHRKELVQAAVRHGGGVDLLVNNAGTLGPSPLPRLSAYPLSDLRDVVETNVVAPLSLIQEALPQLLARSGAVVNVTSDAAVEGYEGWGGYGASKAALEQLSRVLVAEEPGLRVWWVDPGDMRTRMHQAAFPGEDISDRPSPETIVPALMVLLEQRLPSGRVRLADLLAQSTGAV